MRSTISLLAFLCLHLISRGQEINIIPQPAEMTIGKGFFIIDKKIQIAYDSKTNNSAKYLADYLSDFYKLKCELTSDIHKNGAILLLSGSVDKAGTYKLDVAKNGISIGGDEEGVFYGVQTLIQLLPADNDKQKTINYKLQIPFVSINDYPRFAYRGMHLDVGRHFFPVSFIEKYIDYLALHKFNTFHWHLTEDQGWRIEIKKYPKLTEVGAWRNGTIIGRFPGTGNDNQKYGGFYTQEEIKEIVKYAAERYIDVIPEIEMPGHSSAAIAAYPELSCFPNESTQHPKQCAWYGDTAGKQVQQTWGVFNDVFCAGKENTFQFLQDVMDEVLPIFPSKYVHVGGDECPKENWKRCPNCQQRMKDNNLKNEHELQGYFIQRMEKYLNSKGKILIGWDEILQGGLAPNAVVMSWRGEKGGIDAAKEKHIVIMTPGDPVYFDHSQTQHDDSVTIGGYNSLEKVYAYEPIPKELNEEEAKYVLGAQANVWTEYMAYPSKVEYMIFPRMAALSEVLWSPKEKRDWKDFEKRLQVQFKRYDLWKANYSKAFFDLQSSVLPTNNNQGLKWEITTKSSKTITLEFTRPVKANKRDTFPVYDINDPAKISGHRVVKPGDIVSSTSHHKMSGKELLEIKEPGEYTVAAYNSHSYGFETVTNRSPFTVLKETFHLNKASGKKITLATPPSDKYPGDGAFTLVNGIRNEKGLARSTEFLGFEGTDCEAVIDLGKEETISLVRLYVFEQQPSWIYLPSKFEVSTSKDGVNFSVIENADAPAVSPGQAIRTFEWGFNPLKTRYVKVFAKNYGTIPDGKPGAGNKAWLFADEIEVN